MKEHLEPDDIPQSDADRLLDLFLATLPRFDPSASFAERVMARVTRPRPSSVPALRRAVHVPALLRRPAVAWSVAGSAAFSSTLLTAWAAANLAIWTSVTTVMFDAGTASWQALLGLLAAWSASSEVAFAVAVGPAPLIATVAATALAVPVGVLGLLLAFRLAPTRTRIHAAR